MAHFPVAQSVVPATLVIVAALLLAPLVRTVTASLTIAADRTWPFSLERPGVADPWVVVANQGTSQPGRHDRR